ncbi:ECF transporter S component [Anaerosalibacter bizertensis]|uniref:ECF transporter S component n=1 Tax=Anaerosalibacter bizertensis TaxID=932217 RepID=UPI00351214F3
MKNQNLKEMTRYAVMIALTTVMTMVVHIPTPGTKGYLNLGDMVVFLAAVMFGKKGGFIVGGLGSGLADVLLGYTHYAPITFIVKGLEGFIAGSLLETNLGEKAQIIPMALGGVWMAFGYYIAEIFMYGAKAALASMPGNIAQGLFGAVVATALSMALKKTGIFDIH